MRFTDLQLSTPLLEALGAEGYVEPSPIQQLAIPPALEGRDVLGIAQTGTGKTAAFALPIIQRLISATKQDSASAPEQVTLYSASRNPSEQIPFRSNTRKPAAAPVRSAAPQTSSRNNDGARRPIRALVLAPTRELASQIAERFRAYGGRTGLRTAVVFGGVGIGRQIQELRAGVDVLVACPGRLLDLMGQGQVRLGEVEAFVLDEADRMLDMGFIPDIRRVMAKLPARRQTLLFSATMPREIQKLADELLSDPVRVETAPTATPAERVEHAVYFVGRTDKASLLRHLLTPEADGLPGSGGDRVLVFTRTKRGADRVAVRLGKTGVTAEVIHGDKSQNARERALQNFRIGKSPVLVATDLAARGLDVDGVSHVVNFDLPDEPETFVHRIGRTARAGASGFAVSFCDAEESENLAGIEALIRQRLPQVEAHPHRCTTALSAHADHERRLANKAANTHNNNSRRTESATAGPRSANPPRRRRPEASNSGASRSGGHGAGGGSNASRWRSRKGGSQADG